MGMDILCALVYPLCHYYMPYIVYHLSSNQMLRSFHTESSAKCSTTCMNRNAGEVVYAYTDEAVYLDQRTAIVAKEREAHNLKRLLLQNTLVSALNRQ